LVELRGAHFGWFGASAEKNQQNEQNTTGDIGVKLR